jgi:hypothetical protein
LDNFLPFDDKTFLGVVIECGWELLASEVKDSLQPFHLLPWCDMAGTFVMLGIASCKKELEKNQYFDERIDASDEIINTSTNASMRLTKKSSLTQCQYEELLCCWWTPVDGVVHDIT